MLQRINKEPNNLLIKSYLNNDIVEFNRLIDYGENVNCLNENGESLMSMVIKSNRSIKDNKAYFSRLLKEEVILDQIGKEPSLCFTAMHCHKNPYYFEELLKHGVNTMVTGNYNINTIYGPALFESLKYPDIFLELLLKQKPNLKIHNEMGRTIINELIQKSHYINDDNIDKISNKLTMLIKAGADPNFRDRNSGNQAIHYIAEYCEDMSIVDIMESLNIKFDINSKNHYGNTPVYTSVIAFNTSMTSYFIKQGAKLDIFPNDRRTLLTTAIFHNSKEIFDLLIKEAPYLLKTIKEGNNVLHHIAGCHGSGNITGSGSQNPYFYSEIIKHAPELAFMKNNNNDTPFDVFKRGRKQSQKVIRIFKNLNQNHKTNEQLVISQ